MTRMRYAANFFAWASRSKPNTRRVRVPTIGETWVFQDIAKKEKQELTTRMPPPKVGEVWVFIREEEEETSSKEAVKGFGAMEFLTAYGILMAAAENIGKLAGALHSSYHVGFGKTAESIRQKMFLINPEKDGIKNKIYSTSTTADKIFVKVSNIENLLLKGGEQGKQAVGKAGGGGGGGEEKKAEDSDDKESADGKNGGSGGGANGGGNGANGAGGGSNGAPSDVGLDITSIFG